MTFRTLDEPTAPTTQKSFVDECAPLLQRPICKYIGFAILLAWHYSLWFVSKSFTCTQLLDERITHAWLVNLASMVLFLFLLAIVLGRKRHLSGLTWLAPVASIALAGQSFIISFATTPDGQPAFSYVIAFTLGATEAALWILWGEQYARMKAKFSMLHIGTAFGATLLAVIVIALALPESASPLFTAFLPIMSGVLLMLSRRATAHESYPPLLPKKTTRRALRSMVVVSALSLFASLACYFLAAIIPWEALPTSDTSFTYGVVGGSMILIVITLICKITNNKASIFMLYPWLLVIEVVAFVMFLGSETLYFPAFLIAIGLSSIFEVLLIMYFGILTSKGYVTPALAFSFSGGFIRAGIYTGNSLAVFYEHNPLLAISATPSTSLALICLLAILLVLLVRQEYSMLALTEAPPSREEIDHICDETAREFGLSEREREIIGLMARGYTANNIAEKLVISPYTVNTHIRHVYEKMQIHKRGDLLKYLNMQRSDY